MKTIHSTDRNLYLNIKRWFHFKKRDLKYWLRVTFRENNETSINTSSK